MKSNLKIGWRVRKSFQKIKEGILESRVEIEVKNKNKSQFLEQKVKEIDGWSLMN